MPWTQVFYSYDGSFFGFLTCVFESYVNREEPVDFSAPEDPRYSFYPERRVATCQAHARRVYAALEDKLGRDGKNLVTRAFLTCLPQRELRLWQFLRLAFRKGRTVLRDLTNPLVFPVVKAVQQLEHEAHLYTGFVRFSDLDGVLAGEITPKNRVLPLLRPHFCARYPMEQFVLYDKTHRELLCHRPGKWGIFPADEFHLKRPDAGSEEAAFRAMWRKFYDTIAIQQRYNPKCRQTHMPQRFWSDMTEFQRQGDGLSRELAPPAKQ